MAPTLKCALGHTIPAGSACVLNGECAAGNICAAVSLTQRKCVPGGKGTAGSTCQADTECADGLRCAIVGFGTQCSPEGSGDLKSACKTSTDCLGGLACLSGSCNVTIPGVPTFGFPTWAGETCEADSGPPISYFRVPRATGNKDFYRLPFPNDIRTKNGHPDLTGHPTPGSELLGFDPVDRYLRAIEAENDGFGAYSTVFFRFNTQFKYTARRQQLAEQHRCRGRHQERSDFGHNYPVGTQWLSWFGGSKYICGNYLAFRLSDGTLYKAGHTYAVYIHDITLEPNGARSVKTPSSPRCSLAPRRPTPRWPPRTPSTNRFAITSQPLPPLARRHRQRAR